ncbi:MAG: response regulator transcription factor [Verrucomicrobiae bacterium]|nr:response regulator transcription factor [Verrucomicrobiae bacterium]
MRDAVARNLKGALQKGPIARPLIVSPARIEGFVAPWIALAMGDQEKVFHSICAGASGYLLKASPIVEIAQGIRDVTQGGSPMSGNIARMVLDGLIKKEIADRLSVSFHTVDTHLRNIYTKLQVNTQTGAVVNSAGRLGEMTAGDISGSQRSLSTNCSIATTS